MALSCAEPPIGSAGARRSARVLDCRGRSREGGERSDASEAQARSNWLSVSPSLREPRPTEACRPSCRHEAARAASEADPAARGAGDGADARAAARAPQPGSAAHVGVQVSGASVAGLREGGHVRPGLRAELRSVPGAVTLAGQLVRRLPAQGHGGAASPGRRCPPR